MMRLILPALVSLALLACAPWLVAAPPPGLTVSDGVLLRGGRPLRAFGVNYFGCFQALLEEPNDPSVERGFRALRERQIPFVRFMACGYWANDMRLYQRDPAEYFRRLDRVVRIAQEQGVGLVPSLFWSYHMVPDLVGEPCGAWGDAASKTRQFMRAYTRQVVGRYRQSPAIWAWEFGNEFNLAVDLPNAAEHRPPVQPDLGTPSSRSARDDLTTAAMAGALTEFVAEVRKLDPHRAITSGNSIPRASAWHQRSDRTWAADTPEQQVEMLAVQNPAVDLVSIHVYSPQDTARVPLLKQAAAKAGKALFVGEFGVPGAPKESQEAFEQMLTGLVAEEVQLAAVWVYERSEQPEFHIAPRGPRAYQLQAIQAANRHLHRARR